MRLIQGLMLAAAVLAYGLVLMAAFTSRLR